MRSTSETELTGCITSGRTIGSSRLSKAGSGERFAAAGAIFIVDRPASRTASVCLLGQSAVWLLDGSEASSGVQANKRGAKEEPLNSSLALTRNILFRLATLCAPLCEFNHMRPEKLGQASSK